MITAETTRSRPAESHSPERPAKAGTSGRRFCWIAAVPSENWGIAQTRLAIEAAMSQPQPSTGLRWRLIAPNGFSPVESVT